MPSPTVLIGVVAWVATLYAIRRWIAAMPPRLWAIARDELARARAEESSKAEKALEEAAAKRVGALVKGIRDYHDDVAAQFRRQVADAEVRARVAERHAVDTSVALEAANTLVRELREVLDGVRGRNGGDADASPDAAVAERAREAVDTKKASPSFAPRPANAGDEQSWDDANEETKVMTPGPGPLRVPARRPPPVPRAPLPPAHEGDQQHGSVLLPAPEEKKP